MDQWAGGSGRDAGSSSQASLPTPPVRLRQTQQERLKKEWSIAIVGHLRSSAVKHRGMSISSLLQEFGLSRDQLNQIIRNNPRVKTFEQDGEEWIRAATRTEQDVYYASH